MTSERRPPDPKQQALRLALELYDQFDASEEDWDFKDFRAALPAKLKEYRKKFKQAAWQGFLDRLAQQADDQRQEPEELPLFPGWVVPHTLALGRGRRISAAKALHHHVKENLALAVKNHEDATHALHKRCQQFAKVEPYLLTPGVALLDAIRLY